MCLNDGLYVLGETRQVNRVQGLHEYKHVISSVDYLHYMSFLKCLNVQNYEELSNANFWYI